MKKVGRTLKSCAAVAGMLWLCLALLTIGAMMVGNMFFDAGQRNIHNANIALIWNDTDTAIAEMRRASNNGLAGHRIAVGVYTSGQILLPFMWNTFGELRADTFVEMDNIREALNTTLALQ